MWFGSTASVNWLQRSTAEPKYQWSSVSMDNVGENTLMAVVFPLWDFSLWSPSDTRGLLPRPSKKERGDYQREGQILIRGIFNACQVNFNNGAGGYRETRWRGTAESRNLYRNVPIQKLWLLWLFLICFNWHQKKRVHENKINDAYLWITGIKNCQLPSLL